MANELHTAPATETQTTTDALGKVHTIVWHTTEFASRSAAHKALRTEGYHFNQPSRRGGQCIKGTGYWAMNRIDGCRTAIVIGSTVKAA